LVYLEGWFTFYFRFFFGTYGLTVGRGEKVKSPSPNTSMLTGFGLVSSWTGTAPFSKITVWAAMLVMADRLDFNISEVDSGCLFFARVTTIKPPIARVMWIIFFCIG
jgi:hypothetical protein